LGKWIKTVPSTFHKSENTGESAAAGDGDVRGKAEAGGREEGARGRRDRKKRGTKSSKQQHRAVDDGPDSAEHVVDDGPGYDDARKGVGKPAGEPGWGALGKWCGFKDVALLGECVLLNLFTWVNVREAQGEPSGRVSGGEGGFFCRGASAPAGIEVWEAGTWSGLLCYKLSPW
jgi:hypothetical protein